MYVVLKMIPHGQIGFFDLFCRPLPKPTWMKATPNSTPLQSFFLVLLLFPQLSSAAQKRARTKNHQRADIAPLPRTRLTLKRFLPRDRSNNERLRRSFKRNCHWRSDRAHCQHILYLLKRVDPNKCKLQG